jgi:hypothetical protein
MKWFDIAKALLPVVGALIPGAGPLVPFIIVGVHEAEAIPGATGAEKQAHVLNVVADGAAAATASGKVAIDPAAAMTATTAVFSAVDAVHAIVTANTDKVGS